MIQCIIVQPRRFLDRPPHSVLVLGQARLTVLYMEPNLYRPSDVAPANVGPAWANCA